MVRSRRSPDISLARRCEFHPCGSVTFCLTEFPTGSAASGPTAVGPSATRVPDWSCVRDISSGLCCQRLRWWAQHPWALLTLARSDRALARTAINDSPGVCTCSPRNLVISTSRKRFKHNRCERSLMNLTLEQPCRPSSNPTRRIESQGPEQPQCCERNRRRTEWSGGARPTRSGASPTESTFLKSRRTATRSATTLAPCSAQPRPECRARQSTRRVSRRLQTTRSDKLPTSCGTRRCVSGASLRFRWRRDDYPNMGVRSTKKTLTVPSAPLPVTIVVLDQLVDRAKGSSGIS
jgi:hypothetical protein